MFEFVNQVFHLLALGVICITLKMSPSVSQVCNRVHFPSCLQLGQVMWLTLTSAFWEKGLYVTQRPSIITGMILFRGVCSTVSAIFVTVAALQPGSLRMTTRALPLTQYEHVKQAKNKPLCFKSLRYKGRLLSQHNLADPSWYVIYMNFFISYLAFLSMTFWCLKLGYTSFQGWEGYQRFMQSTSLLPAHIQSSSNVSYFYYQNREKSQMESRYP